MKILFVCRGNVGRSQMAEAIFDQLAQGRHQSVSCGTRVMSKEGESREGQKIGGLESAREVIESMTEKGFDIAGAERNLCTIEMVDNADRVIVMAEEHTIPDFLKGREHISFWDIEDPKGKDREATDRIRDDITARVEALLNELDA